MINQREYDLRQLEAEMKIKRLFDEWRKAFLKGRQIQQQQQAPPPQAPPPGQQGFS